MFPIVVFKLLNINFLCVHFCHKGGGGGGVHNSLSRIEPSRFGLANICTHSFQSFNLSF